ncbi:MAG: cation transporter [Chloroflexi bacterium]|nr:cation transporter [Chloroflexota bacterium]MBL7061220.1 cation transporter [Dehalococcoidia bacterium]
MFSTEKGAANLLIGVVVSLILLKVVAGWISGSISVFAQSADSFLDLFAGLVTFFAVRVATKPADEEHPFGHGKVEDMAGVVQGILIFIAAVLIVCSSVWRIINRTPVELAEAGMVAMAVSMIASILLSRHLLKVSRATGSVVLEANARNITADIYSTAAVLVGLLVVRFTGLNILDPVIAIGIAIYIAKIAYDAINKPLLGLVDASLPHTEQTVIKSCLAEQGNQIVGFHELRTRRSGNQRYIDLHLVMAKNISLEQTHRVCDLLEHDIQARLPRTNVTIHVEPCDGKCEYCSANPSACQTK